MILSDRYKFIFFHTPKTGGTTVNHRLKEFGLSFTPEILINSINGKNYIFPKYLHYSPLSRQWNKENEVIPDIILKEDFDITFLDNNNYLLLPKKAEKKFDNINKDLLKALLNLKIEVSYAHPHFSLNKWQSHPLNNSNYNNFFKFAFIREIYDRFFSQFIQLLKKPVLNSLKESPEVLFNNLIIKYKEEFLERFGEPQKEKCKGMDFVGRFENFEQDFKNVCNILCLPYEKIELKSFNINQKPLDKNTEKSFFKNGEVYKYLHFYKTETIEIVNRLFKSDFESLNYQMVTSEELNEYKIWYNKK